MITRLLTRAKPPTTYPVGPALPWLSEDHWPVTVSEAEALDLPAVSAALDISVSLVLQMPLQAIAGGQPVEPTPPILRNPAPGGNRVYADWLTESIIDLALHGNVVAVLGDPAWDGWPAVLYPVPWGQWTVRPDGRYAIGQSVYDATEVFHVRRGCRTGEQVGRGLMETHPRLLSAAVAAERFASDYFSAGASPSTVVTHPDPELTQEKATLLKDRFRAAARRREAVIVPKGTEITPLVSDADKAQLSEARRWNAQQLAMAMGIPGALLGLDSPSLTYRNITDVADQYLKTTIMSYLSVLEGQLSSQCLPRSMTARFDTTQVLRPDVTARVDLAVKGLAGGVYTEDEARSVVDLQPRQSPAAEPAGTDGATLLELVPQMTQAMLDAQERPT